MTDIHWQNIVVKLGDLKPWSSNPRMSTKAQAKRLLESWNDFGQVETIAVSPTCEVYDGHQRLSALLTVYGRDYEVDARQSSRELSDEERRKLVVFLHSGAVGDWNWDELANWSTPELIGWGLDADLLKSWNNDANALKEMLTAEKSEPVDAEPQIDRAAELNEKWQVKAGDLFKIGEHRLLCGDSTVKADVERVMGGEKADCVFTSPPYAVGVDYGETYEDNIESLRIMLPKLAQTWFDIIPDGGFAVVNFGDVVSGGKIINLDGVCQYPMALEYWPVFRAIGWVLWSQRIWCKPIGRVSAPWCASSNRGATNWEHLWTWRKPGGEKTKPKTGNEMSSMHGWCDSSKMAGVEIGKSEFGAGMASGIANWMIYVHSEADEIVHEPFGGTGTTMVACENLHRKCRAIEISQNYCAVILERMSTAFPELEIIKIQ